MTMRITGRADTTRLRVVTANTAPYLGARQSIYVILKIFQKNFSEKIGLNVSLHVIMLIVRQLIYDSI